jgi:hypothetical protein
MIGKERNSNLASAGVPVGPVRDRIVELLGGEPSTSSLDWREGRRRHLLNRANRTVAFVRHGAGQYVIAWAVDDDGTSQSETWTATVTWTRSTRIEGKAP